MDGVLGKNRQGSYTPLLSVSMESFEEPFDWDGIAGFVVTEVAKNPNPPSEAELRAAVTAQRDLRDSPTVITADTAEKAKQMITTAEDTVMSQVETYNSSDAGKAMPQSTAAWTGAMACLQVSAKESQPFNDDVGGV